MSECVCLCGPRLETSSVRDIFGLIGRVGESITGAALVLGGKLAWAQFVGVLACVEDDKRVDLVELPGLDQPGQHELIIR